MLRRSFLKALPAAAVMMTPLVAAAQAAAPRAKITDVRMVPLKTTRELGGLEPAWAPGSRMTFRIGGGSFLEIVSDQGAIGLGSAVDAASLPRLKTLLVGKDPFDVEALYGPIRLASGANTRTVGAVEIALWDLVGKLSNQPVYKLWGAQKDKVLAYASMIQLSTADERARQAASLKAAGWKGLKIRLHNQTLKEDIALATAVRKAVGDDMTIMVDCNQAQQATGWQPGVLWDYPRAIETARELQKLNVYWIEEPLTRYDWKGLADINRLVDIPVAGGENNPFVHEFVGMIEQGVFDILQPEVMVTDGVSGTRRVGALAAMHNKLCIPHHGGMTFGTIAHLHMTCTWANSPWLEMLHDPPIGPYTAGFSIFDNPPLVDKDGYIAVPPGPGFGVSIDRSLIA